MSFFNQTKSQDDLRTFLTAFKTNALKLLIPPGFKANYDLAGTSLCNYYCIFINIYIKTRFR